MGEPGGGRSAGARPALSSAETESPQTGVAGRLRLVRLTRLETAIGSALGAAKNHSVEEAGRSARVVLDGIVADAVAAGPTFVKFSGGRDSSAVLALAVHAARRAGTDLPVPVIMRYPGVPSADETDWQVAVLSHLGLSDPVILTITDQETILSAGSRASLRRLGLVWPYQLHMDPALEVAWRGAQLLTGEGGDESIGPRRITPWVVAARNRRRPGRAALRAMGETVWGPAIPLGPLAALDPRITVHPWLRGPAVGAMRREVSRLARTRWAYDRATRQMTTRRVPAVLAQNYQVVADGFGVTLHHPLQDPRFLAALARDGGRWGFRGRTDTMRFLFSDLLPDAVLARTSKAWFNGSRYGEVEREFARTWDGSGVDHELVDPDVLREIWLTPESSSASGLLMHQAWLASQGIPETGRGALDEGAPS